MNFLKKVSTITYKESDPIEQLNSKILLKNYLMSNRKPKKKQK